MSLTEERTRQLPKAMRTILGISVSVAALSLGATARADDTEACVDASSQGQTLRDVHQLVEARDKFLVCARQSCPAVVVKDCATWLEQLQARIPTVVPVATDAAGNGLPGVKVSMDGALLLQKIEGDSIEVNPGTHTFTFETADGTRAEKTVVVSEGEKETRVAAVIAAPGPVSPPPPLQVHHLSPESGPPWKTIGLVAGGVGVVGLALGTAFGFVAIGKKNDANCRSDGGCATQGAVTTQKDAQSAGNLSTVFFAAGGVLAAAGVAMFVLAPSSPVQVAPAAGANGAGMVLGGAW